MKIIKYIDLATHVTASIEIAKPMAIEEIKAALEVAVKWEEDEFFSLASFRGYFVNAEYHDIPWNFEGQIPASIIEARLGLEMEDVARLAEIQDLSDCSKMVLVFRFEESTSNGGQKHHKRLQYFVIDRSDEHQYGVSYTKEEFSSMLELRSRIKELLKQEA